jgi:ligand-binding sensor domain-containing protein
MLFLICFSAHAQEGRQYSFKHFSVTNGLASNTVGSVLQDREGFMWMATDNGLQRYDGSSFITFRHVKNDPTSIPSNYVRSMYMDQHKNIWLLCDGNQLGIFDTRKFLFQEAMVKSKKPVALLQLFESNTGKLYLLTTGGEVFYYEPSQHIFIPDLNFLPDHSNWEPQGITWDPFGQRYWLNCDSGLLQFDPRTHHANYRGHNPDHDPVINSFEFAIFPSAIFIDAKGNIIFNYWEPNAGGPTQLRYKRSENKAERLYMGVPGYHEIYSYLQQRNGRFWVYGLPFFAEWKDDPARPWSFLINQYRNEQSIKFDYAFSAYEDKESNIWIATDNGIFIFNPDRQIFDAFNLMRPGGKPGIEVPVTSMQEMDDGNFFVGCWNSAGIFYFDRQFNPLPVPSVMNGLLKLSIWDMAVQPQTRDLWVTLQGGGVGV